MTPEHLFILGTHGIPAQHGGFETCAEKLALFMQEAGWDVTVYGQGPDAGTTLWHGIKCITVKRYTGLLRYLNPLLTDFKAIWHARNSDGVCLTMGYNTALFNVILWLYRKKQIINMDGMEWQRTKYRHWHEKAWLRLNEYIAIRIADTCIADHTVIANYLQQKNNQASIETIAYGADIPQDPIPAQIHAMGLTQFGYGLVIARPEPENQILEIVAAWNQSGMAMPLVVLGRYDDAVAYHRAVKQAAGPSVVFPGALYDPATVSALRHFSQVYIHGHTVGGTNPSLVEAMAASCRIIAHDNAYNRGVAQDGAHYFKTVADLVQALSGLTGDDPAIRQSAFKRYAAHYQWQPILQHYYSVIENLRQRPGAQ